MNEQLKKIGLGIAVALVCTGSAFAEERFTIDFRTRSDLHNVQSGPLDPAHYPQGTVSCDPQPHCRLSWNAQYGLGVYMVESGEGYEQGPIEVERGETIRISFGGSVARFHQVWLSNLYRQAWYSESAWFAGDGFALQSIGYHTDGDGTYIWNIHGYSAFTFLVYATRNPPAYERHQVSLMKLDMLN